MILILGSQQESMISWVCEELQQRKADLFWIDLSHLPDTVRLSFEPGQECRFLVGDQWLELPPDTSIYHRLGFGSAEQAEDYSPAEGQFVDHECTTALSLTLNQHPGLVVNPPYRSGSNASKPYQAALCRELGFRVPETLVTNLADAALAFYEEQKGKVIYKSISYLRSIVQVMKPDDLQRLDRLHYCPVQLQEMVEGFDVRVHVVGDRVFPSRILAEESDYRYDKKAEISAWQLPGDWEERCIRLARKLGFWLTGIDLRFTPEGEAVCFEANPSPAFTWYEERTEQPITAALCDLLQK